MEFQSVIQRATEIRARYAALKLKQYGAEWTNEELALGFGSDVGDLTKLIVALQGKRDIPEASDKLAHELSDCLWSVIVLAQAHQIDLEASFLKTMDDLDVHIYNLMLEG
jgi:NTP pyrophosphatase (non-canonical NTP hydrolase)